jgi:hypothetical protein
MMPEMMLLNALQLIRVETSRPTPKESRLFNIQMIAEKTLSRWQIKSNQIDINNTPGKDES